MTDFNKRKPIPDCCEQAAKYVTWADDPANILGWVLSLPDYDETMLVKIDFCPFCGKAFFDGYIRNEKESVLLAYAELLEENQVLTQTKREGLRIIEELRGKLQDQDVEAVGR